MSRLDKLVSEHLRTQRRWKSLTHCYFASEAENLLNSTKELGRYGAVGVRGFNVQ
jgi:hypothetical protein